MIPHPPKDLEINGHRYLTFELIIRICIELQFEVPYAFAAIEIPSRFFLMLADLLLLFSVGIELDEILRERLKLGKDWLTYIAKPFLVIASLAIVLVFFGERIAYIVMMVGYGFRWDRPDKMYYAITRTVYAGGYLLLSAMLWIRFIRYYMVYRRRVSSGNFYDRCGKVTPQKLTVLCSSRKLTACYVDTLATCRHHRTYDNHPCNTAVLLHFLLPPYEEAPESKLGDASYGTSLHSPRCRVVYTHMDAQGRYSDKATRACTCRICYQPSSCSWARWPLWTI